MQRKPPQKPHKGAGHRQRLRERFLASGLDGFADYEVIELLLTLATPRRDCKAAAKAALKRFKSLPGVLNATPAQLCRVPGIGPVNLFGLTLVPAIAQRYLKHKMAGKQVLANSRALFDYLDHTIRDKSKECFLAVYLDAKNRVIADEILFTGTLTASAVYPREVVRAALDKAAAAVIFAHNHPSGDPTPSADDLAITQKLVAACSLMGIVVHEHLIVGAEGYISLADQGHMARMRQAVADGRSDFVAQSDPTMESSDDDG